MYISQRCLPIITIIDCYLSQIVYPETVKSPYFVAASSSCAMMLGLDPDEFSTEEFVSLFSGNYLPEGFSTPWASVYGCHCYGQWFGQLGDGRAMSIGEILVNNEDSSNSKSRRFELQLKGCGRTPFSRGFDGRAVLRSCVRYDVFDVSAHSDCIFYTCL